MRRKSRLPVILLPALLTPILGAQTVQMAQELPAPTTSAPQPIRVSSPRSVGETVSIARHAYDVYTEGGSLHAEGFDYLAVFENGGVKFTPVLGKSAPRDMPVRLTIESIRRGEQQLYERKANTTEAAGPRHVASMKMAVYDRLGIEERYEARADGLEQSFRFPQEPQGKGDLIVRLRLETELRGATGARLDSLRLELPGIGGVTIGAVTGVDAEKSKVPGWMNFDGRYLELCLPNKFVSEAAYPMILDPVLGAFRILSGNSYDDTRPDIAYNYGNSTHGPRYLVVWERTSSSTSSWIRAYMVDSSGAPIGSLIKVTTAGGVKESRTAVGYLRSNSWGAFYVVYETEGTFPSVDTVRGTLIDLDGTVRSTSIIATLGYRPDVSGGIWGADLSAPTVVYSDASGRIVGSRVLVRSSGSVFNSKTLDFQSGTGKSDPKITGGGWGPHLVVWDHGGDSLGARFVDRSGAFLSATGIISEKSIDDVQVDGNGEKFSIVFASKESSSSKEDVWFIEPRIPSSRSSVLRYVVSSRRALVTAGHQNTPAVGLVSAGWPHTDTTAMVLYRDEYQSGKWTIKGEERNLANLSVIANDWTVSDPAWTWVIFPKIATVRSNYDLNGRNHSTTDAMSVWWADGNGSTKGDIHVRSISSCVKPVFTKQPQSANIAIGYNAPRVLMSVDGANVVRYEWRKNGTPISGQNSKELRLDISNATAAGLSGIYSCVIFGNCGGPGVQSNLVELTVGPTRVGRFVPSHSGTGFGKIVAPVGDYDGDGYQDFAIGQPDVPGTNGGSGMVRVISGRTHQTIREVVSSFSPNYGASLAYSDFDGDGKSDVIIGYAGNGSRASGFYSISGFGSSTNDRSLRDIGPGAGIRTGNLVAAGQFDADTIRDFAYVEGPLNGNPETVAVWTWASNRKFVWRVTPYPRVAIESLVVIGDVNGDGRDDLALGYPSNRIPWVEIRSGTDGSFIKRLDSFNVFTKFGTAMAAVGDVNGDGVPDLAIGSPEASGFSAGDVAIYSGATWQQLSRGGGLALDQYFGSHVANAGDYNGDGFCDVLASGSPFSGTNNIVRILNGRDASQVLHTFTSLRPGPTWGYGLASAHTNGDSRPGYVIGVPTNNGGEVFALDARPKANPSQVLPYGRACPDSSGRIARADVVGDPRNGNPVVYRVYGCLPNTQVILALGAQRQALDLRIIGMPGCTRYVAPLLQVWLPANANGQVRIPSGGSSAVGRKLMIQFFPLDPGLAPRTPLSASTALEVTIGAR